MVKKRYWAQERRRTSPRNSRTNSPKAVEAHQHCSSPFKKRVYFLVMFEPFTRSPPDVDHITICMNMNPKFYTYFSCERKKWIMFFFFQYVFGLTHKSISVSCGNAVLSSMWSISAMKHTKKKHSIYADIFRRTNNKHYRHPLTHAGIDVSYVCWTQFIQFITTS